MTPVDFHYLIEKLPHRGAMLLIDAVDEVDACSVTTRTRIDDTRARLFGLGAEVESYVGVELIAQSAAMPLIFNAREEDKHEGMIVQVRSFRSFGNAMESSPELTTKCTVELMLDGALASVEGAVWHGEKKLCQAVITLAMRGTSNE